VLQTHCVPAYLRWALEGARLFYSEGLEPPALVREACKQFELDIHALFDLFVDAHLAKETGPLVKDFSRYLLCFSAPFLPKNAWFSP
jgi:hypothetical protein